MATARRTERIGARPANGSDAETVAELARLARVEQGEERGGGLLFDHDLEGISILAHLDDRLSDGARAFVVVGTIDDVPVGYGLLRLDRDVAMLTELFVHPEGRGVGVAAALLAESERLATEGGCLYLESHVLPGNRAAKNFFERMGLVTRKMTVSRSLTD